MTGLGPEAVGLLSGDRPEEAVDQRAFVEWQGSTPLRTFAEPLLDHLVGAGEDGWRDGDAERLGGFEVNYELQPG
jgi:hypothetical protein